MNQIHPNFQPTKRAAASEIGHERAAEPLVEVLLKEEGPLAAEGAALDPLGSDGPLEGNGIGASAFPARELSRLRSREFARGQAVGAVPAREQPLSYAGKPVATVR